jgi:hypothetical protein
MQNGEEIFRKSARYYGRHQGFAARSRNLPAGTGISNIRIGKSGELSRILAKQARTTGLQLGSFRAGQAISACIPDFKAGGPKLGRCSGCRRAI